MQRETLLLFSHFFHPIYFNPLPLCRGRPLKQKYDINGEIISILSLYAEGDFGIRAAIGFKRDFNPLPLCRGRPSYVSTRPLFSGISILSLYAEGDQMMTHIIEAINISILSLYAEGD